MTGPARWPLLRQTAGQTLPDIPMTLLVSEVFSSIQGEGPSLGRLASFIRLGGCPLSCTWCDTPWTWDASRFDLRTELDRRNVDDLLREVAGHATGLVVITGGEPLLQQRFPAWRRLLIGLKSAGMRIELETSATLAPDAFTVEHIDQINASPKLAHSGNPAEERIRPATLAALAACPKTVWKVVCRDVDDVEETAALAAAHRWNRDQVWVMPEGDTVETMLSNLVLIAPHAIGRGLNVTTRLHTLIWGEERGR